MARSASMIPGMPGVELAHVLGHQPGVGQARGGVVLGMARDRAGLLDGGVEAVLAQVGGAGAALAVAEIDRHGDTAVAGGFDGLDLAHADVDVEAGFLRTGHLGLAGAAARQRSSRRCDNSASASSRAWLSPRKPRIAARWKERSRSMAYPCTVVPRAPPGEKWLCNDRAANATPGSLRWIGNTGILRCVVETKKPGIF
jgi:hypothetical protein